MSKDFWWKSNPFGRHIPVCLNMWVPPPGFTINITGIKTDDGEWRRDLIYLANNPFEKYWSIDIAILLDSCLLHNPLHTVVLHLTTIVIHLVEWNSHFWVSMAHRAYASYAIFPVIHLLNANILKNYDRRIETLQPKLSSSNHFMNWEQHLTMQWHGAVQEVQHLCS